MKKKIFLSVLFILALSLSSQVVAAKTLKPHHSAADLSCSDCHTTDPPEQVTIDQCISCHDLPEAKEDYHGDPDKHDSPHYGPELDCESCHFEHQPSVNFCAECHDFDFKVP